MHDKKVEVIKLKFINGVHIGRGAEELDKTAITYGSDALKSADGCWPINPNGPLYQEVFGNVTISSGVHVHVDVSAKKNPYFAGCSGIK